MRAVEVADLALEKAYETFESLVREKNKKLEGIELVKNVSCCWSILFMSCLQMSSCIFAAILPWEAW